jgi:hypothetical protein
VKQKPKDELFNPISLEVNMERSHARLVSVDTDSGGKEFLIGDDVLRLLGCGPRAMSTGGKE